MNFFKVLKINIIIRVEVYSVADLRKIYKEIRSERNISKHWYQARYVLWKDYV